MEKETIFPNLEVLEKAAVLLASSSPRRRELLSRILPPDRFRVIAADIDESVLPGELSQAYVRRLALQKAEVSSAIWLNNGAPAGPKLVIAADTTVVLNEVIYGKPDGPEDAARMLRELAGHTHIVLTGFAVRLLDEAGQLLQEESRVCTSEVEIRLLSEAEISWYVATGEPLDKAGAYTVQGLGASLFSAVRGDYYNIVGLPLVPLIEMLRIFKL